MARKQPTAEQKAQAEARREKFRQLAELVSAMTDERKAEFVARCGGIVTAAGSKLSTFNSCLVVTQFGGASIVGGFRQWQAHGRRVRKGQAGLMIWCPTGTKDEAPAGDGQGGEDKRPGFVMGYVWDISQTEPIPADA